MNWGCDAQEERAFCEDNVEFARTTLCGVSTSDFVFAR
jgi:hypothetical protein